MRSLGPEWYDERIAKNLEQERKGRIAGAILRAALKHNINSKSAIKRVERDALLRVKRKGLPPALATQISGEAAWRDMHSVAHMWAARFEFPDLFPAIIDVLCGTSAPSGDPKPYLRRCEEYLDQMQARPDLAHPDPWRCSPEMRRELGLPVRKLGP